MWKCFPFTVVQMPTPDVLKLRVILDEVNAEKLNLHSRPDTAQLCGEFHRITNQSLQYSFFAALDKNTPQLLKLYKGRKTGDFGKKMADLLMAYDEQDKNDISATRTAALAGLPLYLKEDSSVIFKSCKEEEFEAFQEGAVALLGVVAEEDTAAGIPFQPLSLSQSSWRIRL
ncbi:uncharacterized protein PEZ65_011971 [Lycodopsis pacificus]